MGILSVIVAAVAAFMFGAIWYGIWAKPWMQDTGIAVDADGKPANRSDPKPYIISFVSVVIVAGMMRHTFALSGIDSFGGGVVAGFGIGAFLATPWIATNYGFTGKPMRLTLIDGGYATFGCLIIGAVLTLF
ncbi:uncharacterized protein DUF1761 [Primorskyibacter sedentarius]|uniref:Uncharacterized protein DUF1761 n=1 Tax=Primorskyibacter sedentarius TaxID=745311 RepID=A0A4R3JJV6_9RHOB|nr:DUF1761 domain-containing protein [Primorskyibacter sedentarius]TCS66459.1 uncharacterized protein DUF1761 [Primorskyibacter sedentarius]